jgi:hypothetical protein
MSRCRPVELDLFKDQTLWPLSEDPKLFGQRVRELIVELGFDGGKTMVDHYLREVRALFAPPPRAFHRIVCGLPNPRLLFGPTPAVARFQLVDQTSSAQTQLRAPAPFAHNRAARRSCSAFGARYACGVDPPRRRHVSGRNW